ncbi:MAG: N-acetylmuramoyl-L-alanine amidase [Chitinophagales bacterium]|nr:N-acetylmuramoyl-L-alanine amidase [Chitinophagales bacterium]
MKKTALIFAAILALSVNAKAEKIKLIIDAAHGGTDAGAKSANGDKESELCLQFANALKDEAAKNDIEVVMVRTTDEYKTLSERNNFKPEAGVKSLYISFHMNTESSKTARGAVVQYNSKAKDAAAAKLVAEKLQSSFNRLNDIGTVINENCKAMVIKNSEIPAILIEPGYVSNEQDLRKLKDKGIQQEMAMLIVNDIKQ